MIFYSVMSPLVPSDFLHHVSCAKPIILRNCLINKKILLSIVLSGAFSEKGSFSCEKIV